MPERLKRFFRVRSRTEPQTEPAVLLFNVGAHWMATYSWPEVKQQVAEMVKALYENDDATPSEFHHAFEAQFENVERPNALEPIILNEIVKFCKFCDGKKAKPESGMLSSLISTVGSVFGSGSDKKRKLSEMQC